MTRSVDGSTPSQDDDAGPALTDEMDVGLLTRGDGMLPIVGLGGSAGAIAALREFFAAMPTDSGMAFVVILHLSPQHESTLAEMFQRSTAMPVVAATDGVTVQPNCVYVIPPGKFLAAANGQLRLTDAQEPRGKRVAVDHFFRTLAETHGAQALAVVLSGAGGDGALGLKRIKELGGLTIAQAPDEAEHPDMPRAAIATGLVDWVLQVNEMPAKLLAYMKQRAELKLPGEDGPHPAEPVELSPDEHESALRDVLAFLHTRTGSDFSYYKRATILRRIARRMQVNGLADLPGYLVYLRTHAGEAAALLQDLLISVTNFFRDPAAFAALERTIPEMFKGKGAADTVRVWVAGCATGEEAYSIAMLLCEHASTIVGPPQIQVFATDLDEEVIREAREGLYPETIAADVSDERLQHFFIHEQGGYRVRRAVRELVLFAPHDLLKDSPFSRLDLVSCRNLLIYLNREAQSRVFDIFHFALRPGGRLLLGTSEAVEDGSPLFAVLDKTQRLYLQRPAPQRLITVPTGPGTLARALALQDRVRERPTVPGRATIENVQARLDHAVPFDSGLPPAELHYRLIERFSPPSVLVNSAHDMVHLSDSADRFLQFTGGEPTRNLLRTVHPMLRVELRAALYAAAQTHTAATAFRVPVEIGDAASLVDIRVTPAGDLAPDFLLVVLEEHPADGTIALAVARNADADQAALHLERELVATKAQLRDTIEQSEASTEELKASNEELQAINEELRSATEELETSREELQSINEELTTVNDELKSNVDRLAQSNSDLQNLMAATNIATVFLDRELRIQRFTPAAKALFNLITTDLGRPLSDLHGGLDYPEIVADAESSLAHLQPAQREVRAGERWYIARILPYRTDDDRIAGVVLTFLDITARKDSENALLASTARFRAAVEAVNGLIWTNNAQGQMEGEQPEWGNFTGQDRDSYQGYGWTRAVHPDDVQPTLEAWNEAVAGKKAFVFEHRVRRKDGQWRLCSIRAVPVLDDRGEVSEWVGVHTDITEQKRTQEALRTNEERLRLFIQHAPAGIAQFDREMRYLAASRRWLEDNGLTGEVIGRSHYDLFPEAPEAWEEVRRRALAGETLRSEGDRFDRADGSVQWVKWEALPWRDATGGIGGIIIASEDISERKNAEVRVRESEERFRVVADAAPVLIWLSGTDKLCYWFNKPWLAFTGRSMDQEVGNGWAEGVHPDDLDHCLQTYVSAFDARTPFSMEYRLRRHDGEFRWLIDNGVPRYGVGGKFEGYIGSCLDVTDYKSAQASLQDADRRKDEFLATLAHELRNPLAPIGNGLEVIRMAGADGAVERARSMMTRQLVHLVRLVDDLVDVSRVTSGKLELRRERLELRSVIDAAVETSRPIIDQAGHDLVVVVPDEPVFVDGDHIRLSQVVSNLLNNSAKYTHRGGHIRLTVGHEGETAVVTVKDDGIGIPAAMLDRVFEMFIQVDRSLEKTTGGLGIGLSLGKRLVEMHGGTIEARSEGEGRGSEFVVRLPSVAPVSSAAPRRKEVVTPNPRRILVVDDNADAADLLGELLEMLGNEVRTAYDGEAGVQAAGEFHPEVVFCDIGMPKVNGYEAARRIREQPWGRATVMVALTGWGQEDDRKKSADAGFDFHLVKPVELTALTKLLAGLAQTTT